MSAEKCPICDTNHGDTLDAHYRELLLEIYDIRARLAAVEQQRLDVFAELGDMRVERDAARAEAASLRAALEGLVKAYRLMDGGFEMAKALQQARRLLAAKEDDK